MRHRGRLLQGPDRSAASYPERTIWAWSVARRCRALYPSGAGSDQAQYIQAWLKVLKADKLAILTASSKAHQAPDYLVERAALKATAHDSPAGLSLQAVENPSCARYAKDMNLGGLFQSMVNQVGVKTIYGDPISTNGKTIMPVAKFRYRFGVGSGRKAQDNEEGSGGGGGFIFHQGGRHARGIAVVAPGDLAQISAAPHNERCGPRRRAEKRPGSAFRYRKPQCYFVLSLFGRQRLPAESRGLEPSAGQ